MTTYLSEPIPVCAKCGRGFTQQPDALLPSTGEYFCVDCADNPFAALLTSQDIRQAGDGPED